MERNIDRDISMAQTRALQQQNTTLLKQNELLKMQVTQLKNMQSQTQKELAVYKSIVLKGSNDSQVLEMQHQRIYQLQGQVQMLQGKYTKVLKSGGSDQLAQYSRKCKEYEERLKDSQREYQKQIATLKERLARQKAVELVETKRLITSPTGEVKKSAMGLGKFV